MTRVYHTEFQAQIALANKKHPENWVILRDDNHWWTLVPRSKTPSVWTEKEVKEINDEASRLERVFGKG